MKLDPKLQAWIAARKRHHLSHAHIQMARELGMAPTSIDKLDNHRQQAWKAPLPTYLEELYQKRFERATPEQTRSIEEIAAHQAAKKADKKAKKAARRATEASVASEADPQV